MPKVQHSVRNQRFLLLSAHRNQVTFSLSKQELPEVVGREIHIHDVSSAGFSKYIFLSLWNQEWILQAYVLRFLEGGTEDGGLK